jgi:hypothetical protein
MAVEETGIEEAEGTKPTDSTRRHGANEETMSGLRD